MQIMKMASTQFLANFQANYETNTEVESNENQHFLGDFLS